ncbi:hypothetical protein Q0M94_12900 [Deinococcus radiomollis]|uniref:hypothetical protein n=1 Tax=Deinococcus radiomollis TaxID=468916 RepID=UPI0038914F56
MPEHWSSREGSPGEVGQLNFGSLSVRVRGEVPGPLAGFLRTDWQRQATDWPALHTLTLSLLVEPPEGQQVVGRQVLAHTHAGPLEFRAEGEVFSTPGLTLQTSALHSHMALNTQVSAAALLLAFSEVQRAAGLLSLHASVLHRAGQTVAISGPSGAGKSTAALRLLGLDWKLVAEDWAWFDPHTLRLVGWDSGLRLRPESLERFAPELLQAAPTDAHGKKVLSPPTLAGVHSLNALYFLTPQLPDAVALPPALGRVRAVWGMVGVPLTPAARQATQAGVNRLLAGVPMERIDRDELVKRLT